MTAKELFNLFSFKEIAPDFIALWKTNEPKQDEHLDIEKWEQLYQRIQNLEASPSNNYIYVGYRWERMIPKLDMNCCVHQKGDDERICTLAEYPDWQEVMGMEILIEDDIELSPQKSAAGLLWEITYYGEK